MSATGTIYSAHNATQPKFKWMSGTQLTFKLSQSSSECQVQVLYIQLIMQLSQSSGECLTHDDKLCCTPVKRIGEKQCIKGHGGTNKHKLAAIMEQIKWQCDQNGNGIYASKMITLDIQ